MNGHQTAGVQGRCIIADNEHVAGVAATKAYALLVCMTCWEGIGLRASYVRPATKGTLRCCCPASLLPCLGNHPCAALVSQAPPPPALINADLICRAPDNVLLLLGLLRPEPEGCDNFYVRYGALQVLAVLLQACPDKLQVRGQQHGCMCGQPATVRPDVNQHEVNEVHGDRTRAGSPVDVLTQPLPTLWGLCSLVVGSEKRGAAKTACGHCRCSCPTAPVTICARRAIPCLHDSTCLALL